MILWLLGHKDRLQSFESWLQGLGIGDFAATDTDHLLGLRLESASGGFSYIETTFQGDSLRRS